MEKTAKITRTTFKTVWTPQNGGNPVYYHEIELDNGDRGQIGCKEKEPAKINPGNSITYTIEADGHGGQKIKAVNTSTAVGGWKSGGGKPIVDPRIAMISFSTSYAKDLIIANKADLSKLHELSEKIFQNMIKLYETIK
jgi:hypothetical protein